jgi:hypothetical protein
MISEESLMLSNFLGIKLEYYRNMLLVVILSSFFPDQFTVFAVFNQSIKKRLITLRLCDRASYINKYRYQLDAAK